MRTWTAILLLAACSTDPKPNPDRPSKPDQNDPAFTIQGAKSWYLIGDGLTPNEDTMTAMVTAPAGTSFVVRTSATTRRFA